MELYFVFQFESSFVNILIGDDFFAQWCNNVILCIWWFMLVADLLLWRRWGGGIIVLASATAMWFLFEKAGYNLLSFGSNVLLLLVTILFLWAKSASLLNRYCCFAKFDRAKSCLCGRPLCFRHNISLWIVMDYSMIKTSTAWIYFSNVVIG